MLVYLFILHLSKRIEIAALVSLLFAIHPMHVEAVSWIATRSNGLYSTFFLAGMITYLKYLNDNRKIKYLVSCTLFFLLALFSKSMAIAFPLVLFLLDYYYSRKNIKRMILEKIPLIILSVIFGIITIDAANSFSHITSLEENYNFIDRVFMLSYAISFYIFKLIAPIKLSVIYTFPDKIDNWLPVIYYISIILVVIIILWVLKSKKYKKELFFGFLFFLVTIAPVLPLFWSRTFIVSERYTYIPYLGIFYLMTLVISKRFSEFKTKKSKNYLTVVLIIYLAVLSFGKVKRNRVWSDTETLLTDVILKNNSKKDVGAAYFYRGNAKDQLQDIEGALIDYNKAISFDPQHLLAYNNRGIIHGMLQDNQSAMSDFNTCISLNPDYAEAYYNRGIVYYQLNEITAACNDWSRASSLGFRQAAIIRNQYCK
jgi:hypothetical protein